MAAVPERHVLAKRGTLLWSDLVGARVLVPRKGLGADIPILLTQHRVTAMPVYRDAGLDRLLSMAEMDNEILLLLEGATALRCPGIVYREMCEVQGEPTCLPFAACWREENTNPALNLFLKILRQRYPDLSG